MPPSEPSEEEPSEDEPDEDEPSGEPMLPGDEPSGGALGSAFASRDNSAAPMVLSEVETSVTSFRSSLLFICLNLAMVVVLSECVEESPYYWLPMVPKALSYDQL